MTHLSPTRLVPAYPAVVCQSSHRRASSPRLAKVAPRVRAGWGFFFG